MVDVLELELQDCCRESYLMHRDFSVISTHHSLFTPSLSDVQSVLFFPSVFSGRTQKQVIDYVKDSEFKKVPFER